MATEKATDTTATQNLAPAPAKAPAKAPSKARTTRARTSDAAASTASTTTATTSKAAPKKARAKSPGNAQKASPTAEVSMEQGEAAEIKSSLLEQEASKSLASAGPLPPKPACKAHCGQCGREMRFVPFALSNLMCRSCYGLDRYRRPTAPTVSSAPSSRPSSSR